MTHEEHLAQTLGLASGSDIHALSQCSGKRILIRSLHKQNLLRSIPSVEATLGERIHSSLEGESEDLERKHQEIADSCDRLANKAARQYFGHEPWEETFKEERLWYEIGGVPFFTAQPDNIKRNPKRLLDVNYKTGRGEAEGASKNLQLRCEVTVAKNKWPETEEIGVSIIQPLVTQTPLIAIYDEKAILESELEILEIVDRSNWDSTRKAGQWCKYCAARAFCPEASQLAIREPLTIHVNALPSGPEASEMLNRVYAAEHILEAVKLAFTIKLREDPGSIDGWRISEGRKMSKWSSIPQLVKLLEKEGVDLAKVATVPFGKLKDALAAIWDLKGMQLDQKFDEVFGHVVNMTRSKGSLERIPTDKRLDDN